MEKQAIGHLVPLPTIDVVFSKSLRVLKAGTTAVWKRLGLTAQVFFLEVALARRLLLRQTVQCAESQHEVNGMDPDDRTIGEELGQNSECDSVVRIIECRHDDGGVRDI